MEKVYKTEWPLKGYLNQPRGKLIKEHITSIEIPRDGVYKDKKIAIRLTVKAAARDLKFHVATRKEWIDWTFEGICVEVEQSL